MRLGIDFGTTRTVVAYADRGNYPVVDFLDSAGDARGFIPSMVAAKGDELRFGWDAAAVESDPSFAILRSFKRLLSDPNLGPAQTVTLGAVVLPLTELMARFLAHVREALASRSTLRRRAARDGEARVVIGVPANAYGGQRLMTLDAFRQAGFSVGAIVNEPSAAGFEYAHRYASTLTTRRDAVVVYDLGGGTFDASLVRMTGDHHEVLATAGIGRLGGDDFDAVLAELALRSAGVRRALDEGAAERLLHQCRSAKEALTPASRKIAIDLESVLDANAPKAEVSLSVSAYYEACMPLVEQSIDAMTPLMSHADGDGQPSGVDQNEIAGIYVVGGASELPIVGRALRERFGRRVHRSPYPSAAVAIGLSIACDGDTPLRLVDRYARTFAVFREGEEGREIVLDPIFTREAVLPAAAEPLVFTRSYRARHNIGHYRFFECTAVDAQGRPHGDMTMCADALFPFDPSLTASDLSHVAVERRDYGPRIVERYELDHNGIVHVRIRNEDTGHEQALEVGS